MIVICLYASHGHLNTTKEHTNVAAQITIYENNDLFLVHSLSCLANIIIIPKTEMISQIRINHFQSVSVIISEAVKGFNIHINHSHMIPTHNQTKEFSHKAHNNIPNIATSINAVGFDIQASEKNIHETTRYFTDSLSIIHFHLCSAI